MKLKFSAKWLLLTTTFFGLILSFQNCGAPKEFIQNPMFQNSTGVGNPLTTNKIAASICEVIRQCHPEISELDCSAGVLATAGFAKPMGLSDQFNTLSSIASAENSGALVGNGSQADLCSSQIKQVTCADPKAQLAYNALASQPYSGSVNLVSGESCGNVVKAVSQYQCKRKVFLRGIASIELKPATSSAGLTYSISPSLPAGLSLNSSTGVISGNPSAVSTMSAYTVTASGPGGVVSNQVELQISDGYQVNDLGDAGNTGGTNCRTVSGTCTLRAAVSAAIASSGTKAILLPAGAISLASANNPIILSKGMEIYGDCENGTVVDGMNQTQILQVTAGPTQLENLTLQNGSVTDDAGAALRIQAGTNPLTANLKNLKVINNKIAGCPSGSGICEAAGIFIYGSYPSGQAIVNMSDCQVSDNQHQGIGWGGGMSIWYNSQVQIKNCTIANNQSKSYGAGIASRNAILNISQSLFLRNQGLGEGGAIFIDHDSTTTTNITNTTFSENKSDDGGAIYIGGGNLNLLNTTFANNIATSPLYGGAIASQVMIQVENSIFTKNYSAGALKHCTGAYTSRGSNLSDASAADCSLNKPGDITNTNPMLASLQDNGGATQTLALLSGSPALDRGNPASCPAMDQRGAARLMGGKCDIGAFEAP